MSGLPEDVEWISDNRALEDLCEHLNAQSFIALDAEFHRERTYFAQLALVQVASLERIACIDPLAQLDLTLLDRVVLNSNVLKVVHAGRQDLGIFFDRTGEIPGPVFDTQIAAAVLGFGDQIGYAPLVERVCDVSLAKIHGRTDWMRRPLDAAVVAYAADDVRYLREVYRTLEADLTQRGRRSWLDEESAMLADIATYAPPMEDAWLKLKGAGKLKKVSCAIAQLLTKWREETARKEDRPRKRIISDEAILDLSRQRPKRVADMERLRSLDPRSRQRYGKQLVKLVEQAGRLPQADWPRPKEHRRERFDDALVDALSAVVRTAASNSKISVRMLAPRSDLERIAAGNLDVPLMSGWRDELVGQMVRAFLAGETKLVVDGSRLSLTSDG